MYLPQWPNPAVLSLYTMEGWGGGWVFFTVPQTLQTLSSFMLLYLPFSLPNLANSYSPLEAQLEIKCCFSYESSPSPQASAPISLVCFILLCHSLPMSDGLSC